MAALKSINNNKQYYTLSVKGMIEYHWLVWTWELFDWFRRFGTNLLAITVGIIFEFHFNSKSLDNL